MSLRQRLYRISYWLGSFPSLGYAAIYLGLIPTFAFAYWLLPAGFFHATLQSEHALAKEYEEIRRDVSFLISSQRRLALRNCETHIWPEVIEGRPHCWAAYAEHIESLSFEGEDLSFIIRGNYYAAGIPGEEYNDKLYENNDIKDFAIPARLSFRYGRTHTDENGNEYESVRLSLELPNELQKLFPDRVKQDSFISALFPKTVFRKPELGLDVSKPLLTRIRAYSEIQQGIGSGSQGNYWRMLYVSAVTITTVGYGDIVPLVATTRFLVSLEAVLGIVLIGLFLNSLSFEHAKYRSSTD